MLNSKNSGKIFFWGMIFIYTFQSVLVSVFQNITSENVIFIYIFNNVALFLAVMSFKEKNYKITSSVKKISPLSFPWLILIFAGTLCTGLALSNLFMYLLETTGYKSGGGIMLDVGTVPGLLIAIGAIAVLPSIFEEFFARGAILDGLRKNGFVKAILISALFFMLMHGSAEQTVHQFLFGLVAAYIVIISGSLITGMVFHFINNLTTVLLMYFLSGAASGETETTFLETLPSLLVMFVIGVVLLCVGLNCYTEHLARARIKKNPALAEKYAEIMRGKKNWQFIEKICAWFAFDTQADIVEAGTSGEAVFVPSIKLEQKEKLDGWIGIAIGLGAALWVLNFILAF